MDWRTAGILAAVVTFEGFRRLSPGALVLRRPAWGAWSVALTGGERSRWLLLSWWPPLSTTVLLPSSIGPVDGTPADTERLRSVRVWFRGLEILSALSLLALVLGVPLATARFASVGFVWSLGIVMLLAIGAAAVSARTRTALGLPRRPALAALWPFAAPHAAERLLEQALIRLPRLVAVRALLPANAFDRWVRPRVYDAAVRSDAPDQELAALGDPDLQSRVLSEPDRPGGSECYCPRCGASYRVMSRCQDCGGLSLTRYGSALPFHSS